MAARRSFVQGAVILSAAGIVSKLLGALYRIPFANMVGNEGVGLYQMAYPIYTALLSLSTGGIPVAVSIMVAEHLSEGDRPGANRVLATALAVLGITGLALSLGMYAGAGFVANHLLYDGRAVYSLMFISPALLFTAVVAPLRGYFQGGQNMVPTAVSQVVEQMVRVGTVFAGAYLLMPYGLEFAAAGATFGAVTGSVAALLVLLVFYFATKGVSAAKTGLSYRHCVVRLARLALPICFGGLVMPLMQAIDALIVPLRLRTAGYDISGATSMYGELTGMAGPLINLTGVITMALAASLVPVVSASVSAGRAGLLKRRVEEALRLAILLCLPAAVGLTVLAKPISFTLYKLPSMGHTLAALAPAAFFLGMYQTSAGALQGLGKTGLPVRNLVAGSLLKLVLTYYLTALPHWGVRGAAIGSVSGFALAAVLNFRSLYQRMPRSFHFSGLLLKPTLAVTIMAIILVWARGQVAVSRSGGLLLVLLGAAAYAISLVLLGELRAREISMLPFAGKTLAKLLMDIGIVRE